MEDLIEIILDAIFEEGFMLPIIIIGIIVANVKKRKKKAATAKAAHAQNAQPAKPAPQQQFKPAEPTVKPAEPTITPTLSVSDVPGQVMMPTVHAHVEPDCDTHDMPGSLGVTSSEGKDPCHEEQLTHPRTFEEPAPVEGGLTFKWSGKSMVQAIVMQEVLNRPCQRRAR